MDLHDRQRVRNDRDALAATQEILGVLRLESSDRVEYPTVTGRRCASQIGSMEVAELLSSTGYSFRVAADMRRLDSDQGFASDQLETCSKRFLYMLG